MSANPLSNLKTIEQLANMNVLQLTQELRDVDQRIASLRRQIMVLNEKMDYIEWRSLNDWHRLQGELKEMSHLRPIVDLASSEGYNGKTAGEWEAWACAMQESNRHALAEANIWDGEFFPASELAEAVSRGLRTTEEITQELMEVKLSATALQSLRLEELEDAFQVYSRFLGRFVDFY